MSEANADFAPDVFYDTYINVDLVIPRDGDRPDSAKVAKRLKDSCRLPIGRAQNNPILDTIMYDL